MEFTVIIFIVFCTAIYLLPTLIGYNKRNFTSILLLNIFLGWTFVGWVIALVWASSKEKSDIIVINSDSKKSLTDELNDLKKLKDSDLITKKEFKEMKKKIINK